MKDWMAVVTNIVIAKTQYESLTSVHIGACSSAVDVW